MKYSRTPLNRHPLTADTRGGYNGQFWKSLPILHRLQYIRTPWIADTPLLSYNGHVHCIWMSCIEYDLFTSLILIGVSPFSVIPFCQISFFLAKKETHVPFRLKSKKNGLAVSSSFDWEIRDGWIRPQWTFKGLQGHFSCTVLCCNHC